jgi:hypothetical protein
LGGEGRRAADAKLISKKRQDNEHSGRSRKHGKLPRQASHTLPTWSFWGAPKLQSIEITMFIGL